MESITKKGIRWLRDLVSRRRALKFEAYLDTLCARGLVLGTNVSIQDGAFLDPSHCFLISIGDNSVLAPNVRLIAHDASTKPLVGATRLGMVRIGRGCFLGDSVIVLPGVTIGDDCIIGAGSVVTRDIPPGSVAAGNPARVLCAVSEYRDRQRQLYAKGRHFGDGYHLPGASPAHREEVRQVLDSSPAYID